VSHVACRALAAPRKPRVKRLACGTAALDARYDGFSSCANATSPAMLRRTRRPSPAPCAHGRGHSRGTRPRATQHGSHGDPRAESAAKPRRREAARRRKQKKPDLPPESKKRNLPADVEYVGGLEVPAAAALHRDGVAQR
jgi:hypothetical protein